MTYQGLNWQIKRSRFKDYKEKVSSIRPFQKCHTLQFNDNRTVTKLLYKMILHLAGDCCFDDDHKKKNGKQFLNLIL